MHCCFLLVIYLANAGLGRRVQLSSSAKQFEAFGEVISIDAYSPSQQGPCTLIFLHGLGDTARGWQDISSWLQLPDLRYVLPTAEVLNIPIAPGGVSQWFDPVSTLTKFGASFLSKTGGSLGTIMTNIGPEFMQRSIEYIHHLIRQEINRGVPAGRIFVGGFSQGGCVAVRAALSFPDASLGGCLALSTFLGDVTSLPVSDANAKLQVLGCHGESDPVVPLSQGKRLCSSLQDRGIRAELRTYPGMGHTSSDAEAQDVRRFLRHRLLAQAGQQGLEKLSVRELKGLLKDLGVDTSRCLEKSDLLELAQQAVSR